MSGPRILLLDDAAPKGSERFMQYFGPYATRVEVDMIINRAQYDQIMTLERILQHLVIIAPMNYMLGLPPAQMQLTALRQRYDGPIIAVASYSYWIRPMIERGCMGAATPIQVAPLIGHLLFGEPAPKT